MTNAPDSPPFALPLRFEEETDPDIAQPDYGWIWDADGAVVTVNPVYKPMALAIIRAVNSYAKMWEALEKVSALRLADANGGKENWLNSRFEGAEAVQFVRTILKEIDNG